MKVIGLDGREYKLDLKCKQVLNNETRPRSNGHKACRQLLKEIYPVSPILEEVKLPGTNNLRADFFLPQQMLIIEVCGVQHYKFVQHFHGNRQGFLAAKKRDRLKNDWCELNNIKLINLPDTDSIDEWKETIINVYQT